MSLSRDQVTALLAAAAAYDNRNPNPDTILAWTEAASRQRWTFSAALDAVHEHYSHTNDFLMPGHVTAIVRRERSQPPRALPGELTNSAGEPVASVGHRARVIARLVETLGWKKRIPDD